MQQGKRFHLPDRVNFVPEVAECKLLPSFEGKPHRKSVIRRSEHVCNECSSGGADKFDESDAEAIAVLLLKDPKWRVRAVERIDLTSASWCDRRRSVHVKALESFLPSEFVSGRKRARLYVPIGSFPKGPLLDFSVSVAGAPAFLLPRNEHARIHVEYVKFLAAQAGITVRPSLESLLAAIFGFASNPWEVFLQSESNPSKGVINSLLCNYFKKNGLPGWNGGPVAVEVVETWASAVDAIQKLVRERAPENVLSAAENPLLALPHLEPHLLPNPQTVVDLLSELKDFLTAVWVKSASPTPDTSRGHRTSSWISMRRAGITGARSRSAPFPSLNHS